MPRLQHGSRRDAVIVGSGPNGLTAAVLLARAGWSVQVLEAASASGGGCRTEELTLPGFLHDICAAVHPTAALSPAFADLGLERFGLSWVRASVPLAHPLPDGEVAVLRRSVEATAHSLDGDGPAWRALLEPFSDPAFLRSLLGPAWRRGGVSLLRRARFGRFALRSCEHVVQGCFRGASAQALFGGCAAHSGHGLDRAGTAAFGMVLALAGHVVDWPCVRGGSGQLIRALEQALAHHGGTIQTGRRISAWQDLPETTAVLFDLSPRQVAAICGDALPSGYRSRLQSYRHGPGVFKVDWALDGPIPWRNPECAGAMVVHVGGTFAEVAHAEHQVMSGRTSETPFVLVAQQSVFDTSRSPAGRQTGWAYCHVPNGSKEDMTFRIEAQVERFAPGFRDQILARHSISPIRLEGHNAAMIGGDIGGGRNDLRQFLFRPTPRLDPYTTPNPRIFICSSATPPGGGVHGMCGYHAAQSVMNRWP